MSRDSERDRIVGVGVSVSSWHPEREAAVVDKGTSGKLEDIGKEEVEAVRFSGGDIGGVAGWMGEWERKGESVWGLE